MIDTDKIMRTTKILLHGRYINKNEADDYLELIAEVKRLRGLLNMIVDKALHEVNTQPNGDDSPYNTILNIAYEGVIE